MMSSLDTCRLSIKGVPGATHGRFTKDKEGTVRDFIIDRGQAYTLVYQHVKECPDCDPNEVLREFLHNRRAPHKGGLTSSGLVSLAKKMARIKGKPVDPALVREFEWRNASFPLLLGRGVTPTECVKGLSLMFKREAYILENVRSSGSYKPKYSAMKALKEFTSLKVGSAYHHSQVASAVAYVYDTLGEVSIESDGIRELIVVAEVLSS